MVPRDDGYRDHVLELLAPLGPVACRAMFGGYGIYEGGVMFALIADSTLYFKVDATTRPAYERAGAEQFLGKMPYYQVPAAVLDSPAELATWGRAAIAVGHAAAAPKPRRRAPRSKDA